MGRGCDAEEGCVSAARGGGKRVGEGGFAGAGAAVHVAVLVLLCGVLFVPRSRSLPLADPDEARCALIVRHMLRGGGWIVPHLNGEVYYDKPAPYFWLAAAGWRLTGSAELGGRLVSGVAGLLAVVATYFFARRVFGPAAGLLAGVVLATAAEFLFLARWYRMDMPFGAAMWAALWWFWRAEHKRTDQASRSSGWVGFYSFCAVATLFKGPAGLLLPVMVVAAYLLLGGRPNRCLELLDLRGILVYLLIAAPWYVAMSLIQPGYAYEFFVEQNLVRYAGHTFGHHRMPGVIYVPILLAGLLPWTIYLPGICLRYFPRSWRRRSARPEMTFLWLAAMVPLVFFMFGKTKLANYILPAFPPLAVMIGALLADWVVWPGADGLMRLGARALLATVAILPLGAAAGEAWLGNIDPWIAVPAATGLLAVLAMRAWSRRADRARFLASAVAGVVATYLFLVAHTAPAAYEGASKRSLAESVGPLEAPSARIFFWNYPKESFCFYMGADEARKFRRSDPRDLELLAGLLASDRPAYCLVRGRDRFDELERACGRRLPVLARAGPWRVVRNFGAAQRRRQAPGKRSGSTGKNAPGVSSAVSGDDEDREGERKGSERWMWREGTAGLFVAPSPPPEDRRR